MQLRSKLFYLYAGFVLTYALLALLPAPPQEVLDRYSLSTTGVHLLQATVIVPLAGIWFAAFYGYAQLRRYSRLIAAGVDERPIGRLATSVMLMAIGLPLSSIIGQILDLIAQADPGFSHASVILKNYLNVIIPLVTFSFISLGARGLAELAEKRPPQLVLNGTVLLTILLGIAYCFLIARAPGTIYDTYHIPTGGVLFTLVVPYMYIWFIGLFAAYELRLYRQQAAGVLYRKAWGLLSAGIILLIVFSIVLQYLTTLGPQFDQWPLASLLALIYLLLALWAVSYIIIAFGAKRLSRIEEV